MTLLYIPYGGGGGGFWLENTGEKYLKKQQQTVTLAFAEISVLFYIH